MVEDDVKNKENNATEGLEGGLIPIFTRYGSVRWRAWRDRGNETEVNGVGDCQRQQDCSATSM